MKFQRRRYSPEDRNNGVTASSRPFAFCKGAFLFAENRTQNRPQNFFGGSIMNKQSISTRKLVVLALLTAISTVLMYFEMPIPFMPPFLKLDILLHLRMSIAELPF